MNENVDLVFAMSSEKRMQTWARSVMEVWKRRTVVQEILPTSQAGQVTTKSKFKRARVLY